MRLIDADSLLPNRVFYVNTNDPLTSLDELLNRITNAPTIDAEQVVRCKDCKHWHEETGWCIHHSCFIDSDGAACHPWESANWKMFEENDFCSYGERKEK